MSETLSNFVQRVKSILAQTNPEMLIKTTGYVDLAKLEINETTNFNSLLANETNPVDPLAEVFAITLQQVELGQVDKVKLAINELLKDYISKLKEDNQTVLTELYLYRLKQIFKRCMQADFPFHDEVWVYLGNCIKTVGLYLLETHCYIAMKNLLESLANMGRNAAHAGLPTASTQACLRALENKAVELGLSDIALAAKNFRFNLET